MKKEEIEKILKDIIVEKTGYPVEILENNAELEADLGIDSLKQLAIFTELYTKMGMDKEGFSRTQTTDMATSIDTIQNVIDYAYEQYVNQENKEV